MGTWDTPVNANMTALDTIVGGVASISSTGGTVTLNAAQAACGTIQISGAMTSSITILFPAVQGWWTIYNVTSNNNSFVVSLGPVGGTQTICAPPGEFVDIQINGTTANYRNLGRVGSLLELATPTIPLWIAGCTVPPYLNCDGTTFSAGTYPQLSVLLGGTTLPDSRGSVRATLNQGTGRLTQVVNGNSNLSQGGADTVTLTANQIPSITSNGSANVTSSSNQFFQSGTSATGLTNVNSTIGATVGSFITSSGSANVTSNNTGGTAHGNVQPTFVCGYTMIRAA